MSDYLDILAEFVAGTRYQDLDENAVGAVKDVTLDTIGAILAGSNLPENKAFAKLISEKSGPPAATIFGHVAQAEPMLATLVNSTAGVALEVDEGNRFGGGHPAIHVIPGAVAVAEEMGASGDKLIESILVGYEVCSRIGGATKARPHVHSHGHWGTIGTAVAVAKLRDYKPNQVREVINLAASMSPANSWTPAFKGATVRNLYPGRSGLQGILAAHIYECGFTGLDDGPSDIFGLILGESFDTAQAIKDLGSEYRIQQNYFKFYACCRFNHASVEAVLKARSQAEFNPEDIRSVEISVPNTILEGMFGEYPDNMLAAKFNVPYAVAAAVVHGKAGLETFYPEAINDPRIRELTSKVRVDMGQKLSGDGSQDSLAQASIRLQNGRVLEGAAASFVLGDQGNRVQGNEVVDKFHYLADEVVGKDRAGAVVESIDHLDTIPDVRKLTSLLGFNRNS